MVTMTMHVDETFATALRERAAEMGKSVNQTVKEMLSPLLGLSVEEKTDKPWMKFNGCCCKIDKKRWDEIIASNRTVDEEIWK